MTEKKTNEELRLIWTTAVADANQISDMLSEALDADERDDDLVQELERNLETAQNNVDEAYRTYLQATANWVTEAPWRFDVIVVSSTVHNPDTETVAPSITFGFRARDVEPITVTLVMTEQNLRKFQADLGKQIDKSIKSIRELVRVQRSQN